MTQRFDFSAMTQRTEHIFECDSKNWTFFLNVIQRIEPSSQKDSKNWFFSFLIFFNSFFQRFEPFLTWLTELNPFWTVWLIEIEPFFSTWVKENDSILYDSKIFFFAKCMTQRMNWSFLENMTLRIEIFERKTDSKNWTFSEIDSMDRTFCFTWPKELNLFSYITQRIGLFLKF